MRQQTRELALASVLGALAVLFLFLGGVLPLALYACPLLASVCLLPVREECRASYQWCCFFAAAILGLLLGPDKESALLFCFLGYYPLLQPSLDAIGSRALRFLTLAPGCFFFAAPMSESLFLLLTAAALYLARTRRPILGGLCGAYAAFTRSLGLLLIVPLLWELVHDTVQRRRVSIRQVVGLLLVPLGFAAYCCINRRVSGNPFQFLIYQREHWNQRTGLFFSTAAYQTDYLLRCLRSGNWRDALGLWLPNLIACFSALILLAKAAPRLRASQTAWFLAYYIIAVGATWLLSAPRYLLVLLPVPLALAQCVQKRTANIALTALSALAALGYLIAFALRWQVW